MPPHVSHRISGLPMRHPHARLLVSAALAAVLALGLAGCNTTNSDVTGSIGKPATTTAAVAPASPPVADPAPLPPPRPVMVQGWTVRVARNGRLWAEHRGELYAVAPGVPLPGLGHIEAIRREGDRLVVVTTKGLIAETQTTASIRPRPRYYTPYWEPY